MRPGRIPAVLVIALIVTIAIVYYEEWIIIYGPRYQPGWVCRNASALELRKYLAVRDYKRRNQIQSGTTVTKECQVILNGDYDGINKLRNRTDFPWRDTTNDSAVFEFVKDCDVLKAR